MGKKKPEKWEKRTEKGKREQRKGKVNREMGKENREKGKENREKGKKLKRETGKEKIQRNGKSEKRKGKGLMRKEDWETETKKGKEKRELKNLRKNRKHYFIFKSTFSIAGQMNLRGMSLLLYSSLPCILYDNLSPKYIAIPQLPQSFLLQVYYIVLKLHQDLLVGWEPQQNVTIEP